MTTRCEAIPNIPYYPSPHTPISLTPLYSYTTPAYIIPTRIPVEGSHRGPLIPLCPTWYYQSRNPLQLLKPSPTRPSRTSFTIISFAIANPQPADTTANANDTPILPIIPNPQGYPPFDLCLLPTYTNNQLRYYHISGAILNVDEEKLAR